MKINAKETLREVYSVMLKDLSAYGGFPFYGLLIVVFYLLEGVAFAYGLAISLVVVTAVIAAIRLAYFKPRPGRKKRKYSAVYERIDNSSFPSIHMARSVMISIAIFSRFEFLLPVLALMVVSVALSRLHFRRHDMVDIVVGFSIGLVLGYYFFFM